ncbi:hypothetical protein LQU94_01080 [Peptoniphilus sp. KCTC 25270]|uniref:hypothetical protein n=1 Tax=Peptoniphilus sp. KCTC 25270 TaxID=2897414 RepID=UPI001E5DF0E4|nr:hypothetical protein [Peptoniphilus sp. KCTC 25270]MCD1146708.1 hypothetical protein [Peptoniphilus sp. KCTC 25270]
MNKIFKNEFHKIVKDVYPSYYVKNKIDAEIQNHGKKGDFQMKKRRIVLVACLALFLSVGVYGGGKITSSKISSLSNYTYTTFSDVEKAEKKTGIDANIPKDLGNYTFDGITVANVSDFDDSGNEMNKRKNIIVTYKNSSNEIIDLYVDKIFDNQTPLSEQKFQETRTSNGVNFYYTKLETLFLGDGSQLTKEEQRRMEEDPFYNVAYGSPDQEREVSISKHLSFETNGVSYSILANENVQKEELFEMGAHFFQ